MKKLVIYYNSKKGTTKYFAENIGEYARSKGFEVKVYSIFDAAEDQVKDSSHVLLGCWTHGLMILLQHPEKVWVEFAGKLPDLSNVKVGLFATYKLATGSMFKKMLKHLNGKVNEITTIIKSKTEELKENQKQQIDLFLE